MKRIRYISIVLFSLFFITTSKPADLVETLKLAKEWAISGEPLMLSELPGISDVMKEPFKSALFDKIIIESPDVIQDEEGLRISGYINMFGQDLQIIIQAGGLATSSAEFTQRIGLDSGTEDQAWVKGELEKTTTSDKGAVVKRVPKNNFIGGHRAGKVQGWQAAKPTNGEHSSDIKVGEQRTTRAKQIKAKGAELAAKAKQKSTAAGKAAKNKAISAMSSLGLSVLIGFPQPINLGDIVPTLKFIDGVFQFQQLGFALAQEPYYEPEWDINVGAGVTLTGAAKVAGALDSVLSKVGDGLNEVRITGLIAPSFNLSGSYLTAELPGQLKFPGGVKSAGLRLKALIEELLPGVPTIGVSIQTGIIVPIPEQESLTFMTGLKVSPPKVSIAGWMEGMWEKPFGLPYFKIGELGIETGLDIVQLTSSYIPISDLGVRGKMAFGDKSVEVAVNISISGSKPDILVYGNFEGGLYLQDVMNVASTIVKQFGKVARQDIDLAKLTKGKIPNIGLDNVTISLAPKDVELADKFFKKGIILKVAANILGTRLFFDIEINEKGVNAMASISNIKIANVLEISGRGPGEGPVVQLQVDPFKPMAGFMIDGAVALNVFGGPRANTTIQLMPAGAIIDVGMSFYGFGGRFMGQLDIKKPQGSFVEGELLAGAEGLEKLAKELNKLTRTVLSARKPMTQASKTASEALKRARNKANQGLKKAREKLNQAQKTLDSKKRELSDLQRKLNNLDIEKRNLESQVSKCKGRIPKEAYKEFDNQILKQKTKVDEKMVDQLKKEGKTEGQALGMVAKGWASKALEKNKTLTSPEAVMLGVPKPTDFESRYSVKAIAGRINEALRSLHDDGMSNKIEWRMATRVKEQLHDEVATNLANRLKGLLSLKVSDRLIKMRYKYENDREVPDSILAVNLRVDNFRRYALSVIRDKNVRKGSIKTAVDIERNYVNPLRKKLDDALRADIEQRKNFIRVTRINSKLLHPSAQKFHIDEQDKRLKLLVRK